MTSWANTLEIHHCQLLPGHCHPFNRISVFPIQIESPQLAARPVSIMSAWPNQPSGRAAANNPPGGCALCWRLIGLGQPVPCNVCESMQATVKKMHAAKKDKKDEAEKSKDKKEQHFTFDPALVSLHHQQAYLAGFHARAGMPWFMSAPFDPHASSVGMGMGYPYGPSSPNMTMGIPHFGGFTHPYASFPPGMFPTPRSAVPSHEKAGKSQPRKWSSEARNARIQGYHARDRARADFVNQHCVVPPGWRYRAGPDDNSGW